MVKHPAFNRLSGGSSPPSPTKLFRISSAVEQLTVNQLVVGSIPTSGANFRWGVAQLAERRTLTPEAEGSRPSTLAKFVPIV